MEKPRMELRYGIVVWETPAMDTLRREHCMCLHCKEMRPNEEGHCQIAAGFFEICKRHGNAFIMTRCDSWKPKDN